MGEDCHDIAFVNLFCPFMLKYLKNKNKKKQKQKKRKSHLEIKCCKTLGQIWPELPIFPKIEILVNLNVTFTYLLQPIMLVNISQISIKWFMKYEVA